MEQGLIKNPIFLSYLYMAMYEFFGMVLFLVGINCSQNDASVAALGLFVAATLTGRVSGGHFNMAVTLAVYVVEGKWLQNLRVAVVIVIIDLLGAFTAMLISIGLLGSDHTFALVPSGNNRNYSFDYMLYLLLIEAFFTMVLVSTVLFVKYRRVSATTDGMLSNLTCVIAVYVCVRMSGPLSGAGLNPSIAISIITTDAVQYGFDSSHNGHILFLIPYIIGPLIGALIAAGLLSLSSKITIDSEEADNMAITRG
jgi:glycerol uptake facilitator-like aquaporin